jgi:hypothetical protein
MQTCPTCGASLAADLEWCNQCYASLKPAPAPVEGPADAPGPGERPLWVRTNTAPPELKLSHEFSRWRAGATSFGPVGRAVLTLLVLLMLVVGYPLIRGLIMMVGGMDVPGLGFLLMYLFVALPAGIYLLSRVWRRERIA